MPLPLLLLLAVAPPAPVVAPSASVDAPIVEQVVAVVRNPAGAPPRAVTLTKLVEEARIALVARGAVRAAFQPLDQEALRAGLVWLLDETLISDEAARLRLDEVDAAALAAEALRFRAAFGDPAEYAEFLEAAELSQDEVQAVLARSLRVRRYLESRVGRGLRVGDDELDAHVREQGLAAESAGAREAVRAALAEERSRAQVRALLAELRARADVRILDPELRPRAVEER